MQLKDSNVRSFVKAVSWRFIGTIDTVFLSFLFTGKLTTAISIGLSELITKTLLYFVHERVWNQTSWQRQQDGPSHIRSITKSLSWRAIGSIDTVILAYFFSDDIYIAFSIGAAELLTKIVLYYLHERIWTMIRWGRLTIS